jgi:hypothetical protein
VTRPRSWAICAQEADALKKVMRVPGGAPAADPAPKGDVGATDVVVKGELASAMLTKSGRNQKTAYSAKKPGSGLCA